jgi:hypothetical protein
MTDKILLAILTYAMMIGAASALSTTRSFYNSAATGAGAGQDYQGGILRRISHHD